MMFFYVLPIMIIVASNVLYNICQKATPKGVNPFSALFVTYLTAATVTVLIALFYPSPQNFGESLKKVNWTSWALGCAIVGLEFGYLMAYRAGWNISVGSLVANIILALILIPIGICFFREGFGMSKTWGAVFCLVGLILINR